MAVADGHGLPVSICDESATPHVVTLATSMLVQLVISDAAQILIADTAHDSDQLDAQLKLYGKNSWLRTLETETIRRGSGVS